MRLWQTVGNPKMKKNDAKVEQNSPLTDHEGVP